MPIPLLDLKAQYRPIRAEVEKAMAETRPAVPVDCLPRAAFRHSKYMVVIAAGITFPDAQRACQRMGGHLAYVETEEERLFIKGITGGISVRIGGVLANGVWRWGNGSAVDTRSWEKEMDPISGDKRLTTLLLGPGSGLFHQADPIGNWGANGFICEWD